LALFRRRPPEHVKGSPLPASENLHMSGNICRCGTYVRIREAIKLAAQTNEKVG